jgi:hypothetical protein
MQTEALRLLVRQKLNDGRLPYSHIPRIWGGPSAGGTCDACDTAITEQLVIEGIASAVGDRKSIQMHVQCFQLWDDERRKNDAESENDEPDQPHGHLGSGWLAGV